MKRKFFALVAMLMTAFSLSSCLSSDDDTNVEYSHDTAITAFSLGTLDRYVKTAAGKDTLLKDNVTGSSYKFYIDQTTRQIYNPDSLPCGVRDTAVLATISSKNSSPIILMDIDKTDSIVGYYSSSDSINFSKPRYIRVYNNDLSAYVTYTVTVNVHKEQPNVFAWKPLAQNNAQLAALNDLKVTALGDYIYVFGKSAEGMEVYRTSNTDGVNWENVVPDQVTFSADDYKNVVAMGDSLYILSNGTVYTSTDARVWVPNGSDASLLQLIGASSQYLYAYTASGISVSMDKGTTWTPQTLDKDKAYLPTQNISMAVSAIRSTKNVEHLMLLGTRDEATGDTIATIWDHTVDYDAANSDWNYHELDRNQAYKMPYLSEIQVCAADTGYVALGSNGKWYKSLDAGLKWKVDTLVTLPANFSTSARFGFCRDKNKYYWIISHGYVWKGRFNRDGWRKEV